MDAGLPSWSSLLMRMADDLADEPLRHMAKADPSDPMRKAEYIVQMALSATRKRESEIIRDALYPEQGDVSHGELADAIARLVAVRKQAVRIITTNFDEVLESALRSYLPETSIESYSIDEADEWREFVASGGIGVLHVHGLVVTNDREDKKPIILTESHFLRYGTKVRSVVAKELEANPVLFIGVSLSDPNLVGPLWDVKAEGEPVSSSKKKQHPRFVLVVPGSVTGAETNADSVRYSVASAQYLEGKLGLKPVFLKSYSQLIQLVSDMSLAVARPKQYANRVPRGEGQSLRYGKRFTRVLTQCYENIGCAPSNPFPLGPAADNLSEALFGVLHAKDGPVRYLEKLKERHRLRDHTWEPADEHFGLFLWLRRRSPRAGLPAPYAVALVGTSTFTHREAWSFDRVAAIEPSATYSSAAAMYYGTTQATDTSPRPDSQTWRGVLATPITVEGACTDESILAPGGVKVPLDRLTVGAVTLNTTCNIVDVEPGNTNLRSVLSVADQVGELSEVASRLQAAAIKVLLPDL